MTEHLSSQTIELLTTRRLAPADLVPATRHLAGCVQCRQKAAELAEVFSRMPQVQTEFESHGAKPLHLDYEEIEGYVDDSLAVKDREIVKRHLASCSACMNEARELESLRDNLHTYPALASELAPSKPARESFWRSVFKSRPQRLAFVAVAFLLIVVATVLLIRRPAPQQIANRNSAPNSNQNQQVANANTGASNDQTASNDASDVASASSYEGIINQAITAQKITTPATMRDLVGKESKLLGPSDKTDRFALVSPVATVVRNSRPTFRWQGLDGATSYSVAILDSNLNVVDKSNPISGLSWTSGRALRRNVVYTWQVTALKEGREITAPAAPAREARFRILSSEKTAALTRVPTEIARSHLKLGILYANDGLLDDAEREFRAAIAANDEGALARKLLQGVRQMRR